MNTGDGALLAQPKLGVSSAVDPVRNTVRVTGQPEGIETGDIPVLTPAAGTLRISIPIETLSHAVTVPIDGDAEHPIAIGAIFDARVPPPVSPLTKQPAQPGEALFVAGQGAPPATADDAPGQPVPGFAWWHLTPTLIGWGAGNAMVTAQDGQITLTVGGCTMTLSAGGLTVSGGDVTAGAISLTRHLHGGVQGGSGTTGPAIG